MSFPLLHLEPVGLANSLVSLEPYRPELKAAVGLALDCDEAAWDLFAVNARGPHFETRPPSS